MPVVGFKNVHCLCEFLRTDETFGINSLKGMIFRLIWVKESMQYLLGPLVRVDMSTGLAVADYLYRV